MPTFYKCTRPDGTDFFSGSVDYAAALTSGELIVHPDAKPGDRSASRYLSVSTEVTNCTAMAWPARVFVVDPIGETWVPDADILPTKVACTSLRVVEEVSATLALGPQGAQISTLIERAAQITITDVEKLAAAGDAAGAAAGDAAWDAAGAAAAWDAARDAARDAAWAAAGAVARDAAGAVARDAAWAVAWDAAMDAAEAVQEAKLRRYLVADRKPAREPVSA